MGNLVLTSHHVEQLAYALHKVWRTRCDPTAVRWDHLSAYQKRLWLALAENLPEVTRHIGLEIVRFVELVPGGFKGTPSEKR
jgi:hypothetical protein